MIGKAHLPDLAGLLLFRQPFHNAEITQPLPGFDIRQHVHQVIVHMVGTQTAQLFLKIGFHAVRLLDQIMGQLGGDVPQPVPLQNFPQGSLAAGVDIGGVKIIHAAPVSLKNFLLGLFHIHLSGGLGKAHTAISQHGNGISITVRTILHRWCLLIA